MQTETSLGSIFGTAKTVVCVIQLVIFTDIAT